MFPLRGITSGLRALFGKKADAEIDEELREYLETAVEEKVKRGMTHQEAVRAVRLEQGTTESAKEEVAAAGWESFIDGLRR